MAISLQRQLALASVFSKVESQLQRLHLLETPKPKKRRFLRTGVLLVSTFAAGVVVAGVVCGRRGFSRGASAGNGGDTLSSSPEPHAPAAEPAINADEAQTTGIPTPA